MAIDHNTKILLNVERLKVLRDLALLESKFETSYDLLTQFASKIIGAPVSLVSLVAADFQYFKSHVGLPEPWRSRRRTPLSHSFCQHVVTKNEPLVVSDAREVDLVKHNHAIPDLKVIGYLGIPLTLSNNTSLGSFCVIDDNPRDWTQVEINIMTELAEILIVEFETRALVNLRKAGKQALLDVQRNIVNLVNDVHVSQRKAGILSQIRVLRSVYNLRSRDVVQA